MAYNPGVTDQRAGLMSQLGNQLTQFGIEMGAVRRLEQAEREAKEEQRKDFEARAKAQETFLKTHPELFGGPEAAEEMLAADPTESPMQRYARLTEAANLAQQGQRMRQSQTQTAAANLTLEQARAQQAATARYGEMLGEVNQMASGTGRGVLRPEEQARLLRALNNPRVREDAALADLGVPPEMFDRYSQLAGAQDQPSIFEDPVTGERKVIYGNSMQPSGRNPAMAATAEPGQPRVSTDGKFYYNQRQGTWLPMANQTNPGRLNGQQMQEMLENRERALAALQVLTEKEREGKRLSSREETLRNGYLAQVSSISQVLALQPGGAGGAAGGGLSEPRAFASEADAQAALERGELAPGDRITVAGQTFEIQE